MCVGAACLAESLVVTNVVYLAGALLALARGYFVMCVMLLVVFTASNAYHGSGHTCCRVVDVCSSLLAFGLLLGAGFRTIPPIVLVVLFVMGPLSLHFFLDDATGGYDHVGTAASHCWWHLLSGAGALVLVGSV